MERSFVVSGSREVPDRSPARREDIGFPASFSFYPYIAVDGNGNAYVTGSTSNPNFPLKNPLYSSLKGYPSVFVTKLNASGSALVYSTFLGGSVSQEGVDIADDGNDNAYVTGWTKSGDFPTQDSLFPYRGDKDVFVTKMDSSGGALVYSTYLGGPGADEVSGIAVDRAGNAYLCGWTGDSGFPTKNPLYPFKGSTDAFISKLSSADNPSPGKEIIPILKELLLD